MPGDDVVVDADLEGLTRLAKAVRIELGEVGDALVHSDFPNFSGVWRSTPPYVEAFQQKWRLPNHLPSPKKRKLGVGTLFFVDEKGIGRDRYRMM